MDWLNKLALPQSFEHIELLGYMLLIMIFLFVLFSSFALWGTVLSFYLKKNVSKSLDANYRRLSKEIMDIVLFNKTTGIAFCVIPIITMIIIFSQLFQSQNTSVQEYLVYSLIFSLIGLLLVYSYKNSLDDFKQSEIYSGLIGSISLFFSLWLFIAALTNSVFIESTQTTTAIGYLFTSVVLIRFVLLLLISLVITGAYLTFGIFNIKNTQKEDDEEYTEIAKKFILNIAFTSAGLIPLFIIMDMMMMPDIYLTAGYFLYLTLGLIFLFIGYHLFYLLYKKINKTIAAYLIAALILFLLTYGLNNQMIIYGANQSNFVKLNTEYDTYLAALKGDDKSTVINAEEIYAVRCAPCHLFDRKLVGPPHDEVIPKYFNKESQLISFIRNPVRVNEEYPPMPNPGLKPDEAKAVAEYLLTKVQEDINNKK